MPHVPAELKERLKREVSIQRLAEARGIQLTRTGKNLMGLCPFHDDHSPSLSIDPVKNEWNCLGACGRGGDVIAWVMLSEGVSFNHAVELLKRDYLPSAVSSGPPPKQCTVPKLPPLIEQTADDRKLLEIVVSYYHETLKQTPEALRYLESRGLKSAEMVEHFRLGFSNRTLGYHLPQANRAAGAAQRGRLQELGILRESGHEHFRGSLVIPIFNLQWRSHADVRAQDHAEPAPGNARSPVPAGSASRGVERSGAGGVQGNHLVRSVDRCADLLVRGLPQRDHQLRGERLH